MPMWAGLRRSMLARMTTQTTHGSTRRTPRAAVAAAAVCALSLGGILTAPAASAQVPAKTGATTGATAAARSAAAVPAAATPARAQSRTTAASTYVAVVAKGANRSLVLVQRATGKVVRTLDTGRASDIWEPFTDVDLAPDGTVWAVVNTSARTYVPYRTVLRRYSGTRMKGVDVLRYATSVRASADSRQLAVTVLSPDGDGDGKGTQALRVITPQGKLVRTLSSMTFPVDKRGWPTVEVGGLHVSGWLNRTQLVVGDGCCDSGSSGVVSAVKPSRYGRWPARNGNGSVQAIGIVNSTTYVVAETHVTGDGSSPEQALRITGVDAFLATATRPNGRLVASIRKDEANVVDHVDTLVARAKAVPWMISTKKFPYRGTGTVVRAFL